MLYKMKLGDFSHTIPTIGFNVEQVKYKNLMMTLWDVGGQDKIRALWKHYYEGTDGLIWIVDSTDEHRLRECRDELHHVLANDGLRGAAVLVYANKQDCANAASTGKLAESLGLRSLPRANEWPRRARGHRRSAGALPLSKQRRSAHLLDRFRRAVLRH